MTGRTLAAVISSSLALMVLWLCLTLSFAPQELILGAAVSIIISVATAGAFTGNLFRLLSPKRFVAALDYTGYFLAQMVRSNIDVLFRVFRPVVPVRPAIVGADLRLSSMRARVIVANSITLTPGTLTVDLIGDRIYIHWIWIPDGDVHAKTQKMVDGFASRLEKIF